MSFPFKQKIVERFRQLEQMRLDRTLRLSLRDEANFLRQLSMMMEAGIELAEGFDVLAQTMNGPSKNLAKSVGARISRGWAIGPAFAAEADNVSSVTLELMRVGEKSGALARTLKMSGDWAEASANLKDQLFAAVCYPAFVLLVNAFLTLVMMIYVVPTFGVLFENDSIPIATQLLLACSSLARMPALWLVLGLLGVEALFFFNDPAKRRRLTQLGYRLPLLAPLLREAARARYCSVLSITSRAGMLLLESLELAAEAGGDPDVRAKFSDLRRSLEDGAPLSAHFVRFEELYGPVLTGGICLIEELGDTEAISLKLSEYFGAETEYRITQFKALMEPAMIVCVSLTTAGLLLALYLPIVRFLESLLN